MIYLFWPLIATLIPKYLDDIIVVRVDWPNPRRILSGDCVPDFICYQGIGDLVHAFGSGRHFESEN